VNERSIVLAADHAGFDLKQAISVHLVDLGWSPIDLGTHSAAACDYPDLAHALAAAIAENRAERGILICGAGIGMSITANRHAGVRAANCLDEPMAALAREHNDANVLCLGSRLIDEVMAKKIVWTFLETPFAGGRHERRVAKIESVSPSSNVAA
jgi:ribose 5-phosphate isomerase B